jgi:hypothetical protein
MKFLARAAQRFSPSLFKTAIGIISLSLFILSGSQQLFSQGNAGRILGSVTDQTGGAVVGATVTILDTSRNVTRTLTTDSAGEYNAPNLLPGTYTVSAAVQGFKTAVRSGLTLEVYQDMRVDLTLQPGEQSEKVTVTGETPLVETTNAELGGTIQNVIINDLPLNGRNFENLLSLRPGVTIYPGGGGWTQSTNGIRAHDNVYLVDGINSDDPWMAQSIMNAGMAAGDAGTILPIDAIDEFKTQENPSAEYGWKPGAVVNIGIKSGTNNIHGTAYAYGRDGSWDALDYFTTAPGAVVPSLGLEQFGASLGGPIKKDKLFYFLNYEDQRYTVGNPSTHQTPITLPTSTDANSLVGACKLAGAGATALSLQMAGLGPGCVPLGNFPGLFPVNNSASTDVSTVLNSTNRIDSGLGKLDYHLSDKNELHGSYFISPGNGLLADAPNRQILPNQLSIQYARAQVGGATWTFTPSSTWVNELRVGYSHYYQTFYSNDFNDNPADYSFNGSTYHINTGQTNPLYFGLFEMRIKDLNNFSLGASWPKVVGPDGNLDVVEHVSYLRGRHAIKFGGEILYMQNDSNVTANAKGPLRFDSVETFFTGVPDTAAFLAGNLQRNMRGEGYAAFVQDDWRIKPSLMLNLGLRYEIDTVPTETNNLLGNFDPNSPTGLIQVSSGHGPYAGDHTNFSPRLGLAWDINGNGKTVVRAGASLIYEQLSNDVLNNIANVLGLRSVPTGVALVSSPAGGAPVITQGTGTINVSTVTYTGPGLATLGANWAANSPTTPLYNAAPACGDGNTVFPAGSGITPQPCIIVGVDPNLRIPYVTTWTLGIQRALTSNLSLDIAYVGDHGTRLISNQDVNAPPLGAGYPGAGALSGTPLSEAAWCSSNVLATAATIPTFGGAPITCSPADASAALEQAARPFNAKFPYLSNIDILSNADYSNYNGLQLTATQRTSHGLSFTVGYTYAHALDIASDNWGTQHVPIYPNNNLLYGNADTDIRHRGTISITYDLPGRKGFGQLLEGWELNSIVTLQSGLPWWVEDSADDFSGTGEVSQLASGTDGQGEQWIFVGNPSDFKEVHGFTTFNGDIQAGGFGGVPCFGAGLPNCAATIPQQCVTAATNIGPGAINSLNALGCYALGNSVLIPPAIGTFGTTGRNIFRDAGFKNWDFSVTKTFKFKERLSAQFRAEFFNLLNGVTFANPYGGQGGGAADADPSLGAGFACGCITADVGGSNPVLGSGGPRAIQLGLKLLF